MYKQHVVSVAEAARLVGRDRKTLYRDYLSRGRLNATQDAKGRKVIAISELVRVFGELSVDNATTNTVAEAIAMRQTKTHDATTEIARMQAEIAVLKVENAGLRDRLSDRDVHLADLRQAILLLEYKPGRIWWKFWR